MHMRNESQIRLDEELQIIRQQIIGQTDEELASWIIEQTTKCASQLKDPAHVRILLDGRKLGRMSAKGRGMLALMQKKPELTKLASWGMGLVDRTLIRFINRAIGMNKMMAFKDEKTAIEWLLK
jgi:hypothetical protein